MNPIFTAHRLAALAVSLSTSLMAAAAKAYPLDAYPETGIRRLEGLRLPMKAKWPTCGNPTAPCCR